MSKKKRRYRSVEVNVCISDFDDDAIIDAVILRGLVSDVTTAVAEDAGAKPAAMVEPKLIAADAICHLIGKRPERAGADMRKLLESFVPPDVIDAYEAVTAGRTNDAIAFLDRYIEPTKAATATVLPKHAQRVLAKTTEAA